MHLKFQCKDIYICILYLDDMTIFNDFGFLTYYINIMKVRMFNS